jgi:hypothetical protein
MAGGYDRVFSPMDNRSRSHPVHLLAGDGWLVCDGVRVGQVAYAIDVHDLKIPVREAVSGTEARVRLSNHSIDATRWQYEVLTLVLDDGRHISGFMSGDGGQLIPAGAPA